MNKIIDAGVKVFKIEGRARSPEYVKTVTECYHEAILSYVEGTYTKEKIAAWRARLSAVFNRGFWMVITWVRNLAPGAKYMAPGQRRRKNMSRKPSTILPVSVSLIFYVKQVL